VETAFLNQVDPRPQFVLQIDEQTPREERSPLAPRLNQQIEVTVFARLPTGEGAKHTNACHAMRGGDCRDRVAFSCEVG